MAASNFHFPKIKFCGFTRSEDVLAALECGIDAFGLNFYPQSPRFVSTEAARHLSALIGTSALRIGVFVNASPESVLETARECQLDAVQFHGDEDRDYFDRFRSISKGSMPIFRAVSWRGNACQQDVELCQSWSRLPDVVGLLVDAHDPIQRGGTGKKTRWDLLAPKPEAFHSSPFLLAGGITPENVAEAIQTARPDGIDVASGIEISPGVKDAEKMATLAAIARRFLVESLP